MRIRPHGTKKRLFVGRSYIFLNERYIYFVIRLDAKRMRCGPLGALVMPWVERESMTHQRKLVSCHAADASAD